MACHGHKNLRKEVSFPKMMRAESILRDIVDFAISGRELECAPILVAFPNSMLSSLVRYQDAEMNSSGARHQHGKRCIVGQTME